MIIENKQILNSLCRLWKSENEIKILCDANFIVKDKHSLKIESQPFQYRNKYQINV